MARTAAHLARAGRSPDATVDHGVLWWAAIGAVMVLFRAVVGRRRRQGRPTGGDTARA